MVLAHTAGVLDHARGGEMKREKNDLSQYSEVKIISTGYTRPGSNNAEDEVNRLLGEGWRILETYTTCYSNSPPLTFQQEVHFVLGKREIIESDHVVSALQA